MLCVISSIEKPLYNSKNDPIEAEKPYLAPISSVCVLYAARYIHFREHDEDTRRNDVG